MGNRSFLEVKSLGHGVDHPPPSSTKVKGRVELYICSPSAPFVACSGVKFIFFFTFTKIPTSGTSDVRTCEVEEALVALHTFKVMKFGLVIEF